MSGHLRCFRLRIVAVLIILYALGQPGRADAVSPFEFFEYHFLGTWDFLGPEGDPMSLQGASYELVFRLFLRSPDGPSSPLFFESGSRALYPFDGRLTVDNYAGPLAGFNGTHGVTGQVDFVTSGGPCFAAKAQQSIHLDQVSHALFSDVPIPLVKMRAVRDTPQGEALTCPLGTTLLYGGLFSDSDIESVGPADSTMFAGKFTNSQGTAFSFHAMPESSSFLLLGAGLVGLYWLRKQFRR